MTYSIESSALFTDVILYNDMNDDPEDVHDLFVSNFYEYHGHDITVKYTKPVTEILTDEILDNAIADDPAFDHIILCDNVIINAERNAEMYYSTEDNDEIVSYYDEENLVKYIQHILTFRVTYMLTHTQTMFFLISKCICPEVFPTTFVSVIVGNIMLYVHDDCMVSEYAYVENNDIKHHNTISNESRDSSEINIDDQWYHDDMSLDCAHHHRENKHTHWRIMQEVEAYQKYLEWRAFGASSDYNNFICDVPASMNNVHYTNQPPLIDSGASLCGTNNVKLLNEGSVQQCEPMTVKGPFGSAGTSPDVKGDFGVLGLNMVHMYNMNGTLLAVSAICDGGKANIEHVCIFTKNYFQAYPVTDIVKALEMISTCQPTISGIRRNNLYELAEKPAPIPREVSLFLMDVFVNLSDVRPKSLYLKVHYVTGHPGVYGMEWHKKNSVNAQYTKQDAEQNRDICPGWHMRAPGCCTPSQTNDRVRWPAGKHTWLLQRH